MSEDFKIFELPEEPLFEIHRTQHGFFAVRDSDPRFCLHGQTAGEAAQKAVSSLEFYETIKTDREQARKGDGL